MTAVLSLTAPSFLVSYRAQAVVEGARVERAIGPAGQIGYEWEASAFVAQWPEAEQGAFHRLARRVSASGQTVHAHVSEGERTGRFDGVLSDPCVPAWVREDTGPFTLLVIASATPSEDACAQRRQHLADARAQQLNDRPATAPPARVRV